LSRSTNPEYRTTPEYVRKNLALITLRVEYKSIVYSSENRCSYVAPVRWNAQWTKAVDTNTMAMSARTTHQYGKTRLLK
jgi:hypothetical protein